MQFELGEECVAPLHMSVCCKGAPPLPVWYPCHLAQLPANEQVVWAQHSRSRALVLSSTECSAEAQFTRLAKDVLFNMCTFLDAQDVCMLQSTCTTFYRSLSPESRVWSDLAKRDFGGARRWHFLQHRSYKSPKRKCDNLKPSYQLFFEGHYTPLLNQPATQSARGMYLAKWDIMLQLLHRSGHKVCFNCGSTSRGSQWRSGPFLRRFGVKTSLCNKCGMRWSTHDGNPNAKAKRRRTTLTTSTSTTVHQHAESGFLSVASIVALSPSHMCPVHFCEKPSPSPGPHPARLFPSLARPLRISIPVPAPSVPASAHLPVFLSQPQTQTQPQPRPSPAALPQHQHQHQQRQHVLNLLRLQQQLELQRQQQALQMQSLRLLSHLRPATSPLPLAHETGHTDVLNALLQVASAGGSLIG